jgi:hypothetical protein
MTSTEQGPAYPFDMLQDASLVITPLVEEYAPGLFSLIDANRVHLDRPGVSTSRDYQAKTRCYTVLLTQ